MDLLQLTDSIHEAWKQRNLRELQRLAKQLPEGFQVCVVEPKAVHPTIAIVREEDILEAVEGFHCRLDGGIERKRSLVTNGPGG